MQYGVSIYHLIQGWNTNNLAKWFKKGFSRGVEVVDHVVKIPKLKMVALQNRLKMVTCKVLRER